MATFNDRITELYEEARDQNYKVGRKAFAAMIGATGGQLDGWLDNNVSPNIEVIKKVAKKAGVSLLWLIGESDEREYPSCQVAGLSPKDEEDYEILLEFLRFRRRRKEQKENNFGTKEK